MVCLRLQLRTSNCWWEVRGWRLLVSKWVRRGWLRTSWLLGWLVAWHLPTPIQSNPIDGGRSSRVGPLLLLDALKASFGRSMLRGNNDSCMNRWLKVALDRGKSWLYSRFQSATCKTQKLIMNSNEQHREDISFKFKMRNWYFRQQQQYVVSLLMLLVGWLVGCQRWSIKVSFWAEILSVFMYVRVASLLLWGGNDE